MRRVVGISIAILLVGWGLTTPTGQQTTINPYAVQMNSGCVLYSGSGTPEGTLVGKPCDRYLRSDGASVTLEYVKDTGTGTDNSGWVTDKRFEVFVRKAADESVTSNATIQADDELTFTVAASEVWEYEFHLVYLGNTTGDFRCGLKFPTTPTEISYYTDGIISTAVNDAATGISGDRGLTHETADATAGVIMGADTNKSVCRMKGFLRNSTNAGSVTAWWAQGTSDGTATTVKVGSFLIARRIS